MLRMAFEQATSLGGFLNIYVSQASKVASSVTPYIEVRGDMATFGQTRMFEPQIKPAQNDGFMIGLKMAMLERALGDQMDPEHVLLVLSDPSVLPNSFNRYQVLRGNNMGPRIQFPSDWLSIPVSSSGVEAGVTDKYCDNHENDFLYGFRRLLIQQIGVGSIKANDAALLVHMSPKTLSRQLSALGTSISKELSQAKMDYAKDALEGSERSVEDIASVLGYSNASNFTRAFIKEENMNPMQFRSQRG